MLPASNRGAGMNIGFPDVCLTPAGPAVVPVPYPNIAMNAQAAPFSPVVKISMMNALNMSSKIPMTSGDEGGVAHPTIKGMGAYTMGNPLVFIDQMPAINLLCPTTGNNMNNPLGAVLVPSAVNVLYTYREEKPGAELDLEGLRALHARLHEASPLAAVEGLPGELGRLVIAHFSADLPARVHDAVRRLEGQGARALVLDLRGCPGGDLDAAVRLAGDFLPEGTAVARVEDGDGDTLILRASPGHPCALPLVLLVDRHTASAAEVFAGALQVNRRAVVVGERTYGKTTAQSVLPGPAGEGAHYLTAALCAPGEEGERGSVVPDLELDGEGEEAILLAGLDVARELLLLG